MSRSDKATPVRHVAPHTFDSKLDAEAWLTDERRLISAGTWTPPADRQAAKLTKAKVRKFGPYARAWLAEREATGTLKPTTLHLYERLLAREIEPTFADVSIDAIAPADVREWYATRNAATPTRRAHAYGLLRTVLNAAVKDEDLPIDVNPCRIDGAGVTRRAKKIVPATVSEVDAIATAMAPRLALLVELAAWGALRFGEVVELRRGDVELATDDDGLAVGAVLTIDRAVTTVPGRGHVVGTPKSEAGRRVVHLPPHLAPDVQRHLKEHVGPGREALLFSAPSGGTVSYSYVQRHFAAARSTVGRDDLSLHGLRHSGAVFAALSGANLKELMGRLGHSTTAAALKYQHVAAGRDAQIAANLSKLAGGTQR